MKKIFSELLALNGRNSSKTFIRRASKDSDEKKPATEMVCAKPDVVYDHLPEMYDRGVYSVDTWDREKQFEEPRVVIIGAGMAGLSAAARLSERGINNYVVLEALNRPGGRIHSVWIGDSVAELGAQYNAGRETNTLFKILASLHPNELYLKNFNSINCFDRPTKGTMQFAPTINAYYKFKQIENEGDSIFCHGGNKQHGSLLNFMSLRIQQELHTFPEEQQHDAARVMFGLLHLMMGRSTIDSGPICCYHDGCYMHYPGSEVRIPLGLTGILAPVMRKIGGTVRYCKPVHCVYWGTCVKSGFRAVVVCADGDEFPADYVIVTPSIGVLKKGHDKLFCPELSAAKTNAICRLCCGHCNKIYLEYSLPFWAWQTCNLNLNLANNSGSLTGWTSGITATEIVRESKCVLAVWMSGKGAIEMETLCDRDIAEGVTCALRVVTGQEIPYPCNVVRSRWSTDPFFLCAFSEDQCDNGQAQRELAKPLPEAEHPVAPILLFAGDATVPGLHATVSAARISGIREAERVMSLTRKFRGPPLPFLDSLKEKAKASN